MANITRFDPLTELVNFAPMRSLEDFFRMLRLRSFVRDLPDEPEIRMDVSEDDKAYHVKAEIPGVKMEDIHVTIEDTQVSVSAEVSGRRKKRKATSFCAASGTTACNRAASLSCTTSTATRPKRSTRTAFSNSRCRRKATAVTGRS
jgi:HSP20 family molecular chaperone IbpA